MANEPIIFDIDGDASGLVRAVGQAEGALGRLGTAQTRASGGASKMRAESQKVIATNERLSTGAKALGGRFGELSERLNNASKSMGAFGVASLAGTALIATYGRMGRAIVDVTKAAITLSQEQGEALGVTKEQTAALAEADAAFRGYEAAVDRATVALGAGFAPIVSDVARVLGQTVDAITDVTTVLGSTWLGTVADAAFGLGMLRGQLEALDAVTRSWRRETEAVDDSLNEEIDGSKLAADAAKKLAAAEKDLVASKRTLLDLEVRRAATSGDTDAQIAAVRALAAADLAALEARADAIGTYGVEYSAAQAAIQVLEEETALKVAALEADRTKRREEGAAKRGEVAAREAEAELRLLAEAGMEQIRIAEEQAEALAEVLAANDEARREAETERLAASVEANRSADAATAESKKSLRDMEIDAALEAASILGGIAADQFKNQKTGAIFESIINTAVAVTKTLATLGVPAGIPAAAIAGGMGAIQTAAIAAQPPPKFHSGGVVGEDVERRGSGRGGRGPGDVQATLQRGERVLTPEQQGGGGGSVQVLVQLDSRIYEQQARASRARGALRDRGVSSGQRRYQRGR